MTDTGEFASPVVWSAEVMAGTVVETKSEVEVAAPFEEGMLRRRSDRENDYRQ